MLWRFSLYGFLKNQRYFEPFIILAFREKGLSFFMIGILIAFREITINLFEIPSGAVADLWGRRKSMMLSFAAYIVSFAVFAVTTHVGLLFLAMFFFAIGEAFRSGTHKAMIFTWLRMQGREAERTKVYGYTRSWSKIGSAVSVVLASVFVFVSRGYTHVFYFSIVPYVLDLINFLGYPKELDGERKGDMTVGGVISHLWDALKITVKAGGLRRLVLESMGFEGLHKATSDYLQPVVAAASSVLVVGVVALSDLNEPQKAAIVMGPVMFVLYLLSAAASRNAHRIAEACGGAGDDNACISSEGEDRCARLLWGVYFLIFAAMVPLMYYDVQIAMIVGFVLLSIMQNFWRPVHISRFDSRSSEAQGATVLSIESQAKSGATMVIAPLLGLAVDYVAANGPGGAFWPVGALGAVVALLFLVVRPARDQATQEGGSSDSVG